MIVIVTAFAAWLLWFVAMAGPVVDDLDASDPHHIYWGLILVALAGGLEWHWSLQVVGVAVAWDDALQHAWQRWKNPAARSPLHRLYGCTLYRIGWIRRINAWLDGQ